MSESFERRGEGPGFPSGTILQTQLRGVAESNSRPSSAPAFDKETLSGRVREAGGQSLGLPSGLSFLSTSSFGRYPDTAESGETYDVEASVQWKRPLIASIGEYPE